MPKKIFIIEDDVNILYSLQAKLRVDGHQVITSMGNETDEIVLEKIKSHSPDYLILDLILPVSDGFNILRLLKSSWGLPHLPVFIFTSLGDSESREKVDKLGASHYLLKSELNIDEALEKINKILANKEKLAMHLD